MSVSCECCVLSGRGLCDGLITPPEEAYRAGLCTFTLQMRRFEIVQPTPRTYTLPCSAHVAKRTVTERIFMARITCARRILE